jgi:hypothetical protein
MTTLNKLLHQIHAIKSKTEMQSELSRFKTEIRNIVESGGLDEEDYFINHTGRELFRKLDSFGMQSEIKDSVDSGFRPIRKTKLSNLNLNIKCHLDASVAASITESSGKVSMWRDVSGNNFHASTSTANKMPTTNSVTCNGLNVINFDGTDNCLTFSSVNAVSLGYTTLFTVYKSDTSNKDYIIGTANVAPNKSRFYLRSDSSIIGSFDGQSDKVNFKNQNDTGKRISTQETVLGTTKGKLGTFLYRDGVFQNSKPDVVYVHEISSTQSNNEDMKKLLLGCREDKPNNKHEGFIAELIFINNQGAQLPQEIRQGLEGYLAHKWGLTSKLESGHPYKNYLYKFFDF